MTEQEHAGAYRPAQPGDDLTHARWRPTAGGGSDPWVPAEPLGWQDERPLWVQRIARFFRWGQA